MIAVVVEPEFAVNLAERHPATMERLTEVEDFPGQDWHWACKYPISTPGSTFYLPYFHRTLADYKREIKRAGLELSEIQNLSVVETEDAHRYFDTSDYGKGIINTVSSMCLVIRKGLS